MPELVRSLRRGGHAGDRGDLAPASARSARRAASWKRQSAASRRKFPGMRILGPNCLGIMVPGIHLNASFAAATPTKGHIGFISQSGALCTSVLDWAIDAGIGFSYFVSVGNMLDVSIADLIDYFGSATDTQSIILYIESITEAREFMSGGPGLCADQADRGLQGGPLCRVGPGRRLAHRRHGRRRRRVRRRLPAGGHRADLPDRATCSTSPSCWPAQQPPKGDRLAIITNAGGPGVMTTDVLHRAATATLAKLSAGDASPSSTHCLPPFWSHGNPSTCWATPRRSALPRPCEIVLADPDVDAVLVILTPQAMTDATGTARAVASGVGRGQKPVLAAWMGGHSVAEGMQRAGPGRHPHLRHAAKRPVRAFMHLVSYARNLEILHETPREISPSLLRWTAQRVRRACSDTVLSRGRRHPLGRRLQDLAGRLRDSGRQAADRPARRKTPSALRSRWATRW